MPTTSDPRTEALQHLSAGIEARSLRCGVLGLGFIGSTLMDALVAWGWETWGVDRDPNAVERYRSKGPARWQDPSRPWHVGVDPLVLAQADVIVIAVRGLVRPDHTIDWEPLHAAADTLRRLPVRPRLLLLESTVAPGMTRAFAREMLGIGPNDPVFVAHSPERLSVGHDWEAFHRIPHVVGGLDDAATTLAARFLATVVEQVVPVPTPEASELTKLLENAFMSVGIALVAEVTRAANNMGIDASAVCRAAATKPFGYFAFHPGPGVGGHCLPNDLDILRATCREQGWAPSLLDATARVSEEMPKTTLDRLESFMATAGLPMDGARVLLVGVGFKIDSADTSATPARAVARELRLRGAVPLFMDQNVTAFEADGIALARLLPDDLPAARLGGVLILSGDRSVHPEALKAAAPVILDTGGGKALASPMQAGSVL